MMVRIPTNSFAYETLTALGISRNQQASVFDNLSDVMKFVDEWSDKRHDLPFNTDGLVIKINDREVYDNLGMVGKKSAWGRWLTSMRPKKLQQLFGI